MFCSRKLLSEKVSQEMHLKVQVSEPLLEGSDPVELGTWSPIHVLTLALLISCVTLG